MNEQHHNAAGTNLVQLAVAILGGLISPILVIYLFTRTEPLPVADNSQANASQVEERIKPVASVEVEDPATLVAENLAADKSASMSGEEIVKNSCAACHSAGVMGSPKMGDKAAWGPRIAQGYETLLQHAIKGLRMMPAKGGNASLSDEEVAKAVVFMANESGANFSPAAK